MDTLSYLLVEKESQGLYYKKLFIKTKLPKCAKLIKKFKKDFKMFIEYFYII